MWNDPARAQELGRERARLEDIVLVLEKLGTSATENAELLEMAVEEADSDAVADIELEIEG